MTKLDAGDLRFGCGPAPAVKLVPDAVARFIGAHPKIRTSFQVDNWEKLSRALSREEIEFLSPTSASSRPTRTSRPAH